MESILGMRDIYPREARLRRKIQETLCQLFKSWGYEEVEPPTVESYEIFAQTTGEEIRERMYQFVNREGKLVCLRPEFTTSVARMFAKEEETNLPRRVYYAGKIFRYPASPFCFESELTQIGVEHIGSNTIESDGEVIALAVSSLKALGIHGFQVDIGHVGVFRYLLAKLPLTDEERSIAKDLIKKKDFVALQNFWQKKKLEEHPAATFLLRFPFLRGREEILLEGQEWSQDSEWTTIMEYLKQIFVRLREFGLAEHLFLNLGLIRDFDYYTGVIWEGFSPHLGYPLLAGGRYDELFQIFGKDFPSCGFALFLERVVEAMQKYKSWEEKVTSPIRLTYPPGWGKKAFEVAEKLRQEGFSIVMEETEDEAFTLTSPVKTIQFSIPEMESIEKIIKELRS
ncbi:MAG: ATP phosphoribosyltransferase regulatory subunit [Atribacterota bacterium]